MNCPFCNIYKKNIVLEQGKNVFVIFSNPRLMPGHLLVIPKRHVEKISELNSEEQQELLDTVVKFQEKILDKIAVGCDIKQNYRPFQKKGGLSINHLHIHLLPRKLFDELYEKCQKFETNIFKELKTEEFEKIFKILSE